MTRRLGEASAGFKALAQVWSHANIPRARKVEIYIATVVSKILYNLDSIWLLQADLHRIDAFHISCLRRMYGIPCSYLSRIPNKQALAVSRQKLLSAILLERQIKLYLRIAALPSDHMLRVLTCEPGSSKPRVWNFKRKPGRPKQQWASCIHRHIDRERVT